MAFYSVCLSRHSLVSLSSALLHRNQHHKHLYGASSRRRISILVSSNPCFPSTNLEAAERRPPRSHLLQWFRFTGSLSSEIRFTGSHIKCGEFRQDGKLYKFDDNHWIVDVEFEGYEEIRCEEMVEIYFAFAAKVFGSVEEANKRIYSYSTDNDNDGYCFHVECSWDTARIFKLLPGVNWVFPDLSNSYLKPVSKKQQKRIAETKKRQKQIAESKKKHRILCKKRVICRSIKSGH